MSLLTTSNWKSQQIPRKAELEASLGIAANRSLIFGVADQCTCYWFAVRADDATCMHAQIRRRHRAAFAAKRLRSFLFALRAKRIRARANRGGQRLLLHSRSG